MIISGTTFISKGQGYIMLKLTDFLIAIEFIHTIKQAHRWPNDLTFQIFLLSNHFRWHTVACVSLQICVQYHQKDLLIQQHNVYRILYLLLIKCFAIVMNCEKYCFHWIEYAKFVNKYRSENVKSSQQVWKCVYDMIDLCLNWNFKKSSSSFI